MSHTHSMFDLDDTWLEYLKSDRKKRVKMCEDFLAVDGVVCTIGILGFIAFAIFALCKGWI